MAADLNDDGASDLATCDGEGGTVSVMLAKGDGTFAPRVEYVVGTDPVHLATGDLDGDGALDLVTANYYGTASVSVLRGNGDGSFRTAIGVSGGEHACHVAIAELNGDGTPDLLVARLGYGTSAVEVIQVLLGLGNGTFAPGQLYPAGGEPYDLAVADVDGDGRGDMLAAVRGAYTEDSVVVRLGNGDGSFGQIAANAVAFYPGAMAVADFDRDGDADIAVSCGGSGYGLGRCVSVLPGNGDGTFATRTDYAAGGMTSSMVAADLDGDEMLDLAVRDDATRCLSVLQGKGDGTFSSPVDHLTTGATYIACGDFDADGRPDLAAGGEILLSVLLGNGDGTFGTRLTTPTGTQPLWVAIGDLDGDGAPDAVSADYYASCASVRRGNGDGTFAMGPAYSVGLGPRMVVLDDLDGDGRLDLATADADGSVVTVRLGNGDGTFQAGTAYPMAGRPQALAPGDLDGDGAADIVTANAGANSVSVRRGNGDGTFAARVDYGTGGYPVSVAIGDLDRDGVADLVTANNISSTVSVLPGQGGGTFGTRMDYPVGSQPWSVALGDLDEDGDQDVATANVGGRSVSVLLGNGDGALAAAVSHAVAWPAQTLAVGDANDDGHLDLIIAHDWTFVSVLLGDGHGAFAAPQGYGAGEGAFAMALADLDGDGKPDLVTADPQANSLTTLRNEGPVDVVEPNGGEVLGIGATWRIAWSVAAGGDSSLVDILLSRGGTSGPWETIAAGLPAATSHDWVVTGPATTDACIRVVVHGGDGGCDGDLGDAPFAIADLTGVGDGAVAAFSLEPPAPNPLSGVGTVCYTLPRDARVRVSLFDVLGREIAVLADGVGTAGRHQVRWDAAGLRSQLCFLRLRAPDVTLERRVAVVR